MYQIVKLIFDQLLLNHVQMMIFQNGCLAFVEGTVVTVETRDVVKGRNQLDAPRGFDVLGIQ